MRPGAYDQTLRGFSSRKISPTANNQRKQLVIEQCILSSDNVMVCGLIEYRFLFERSRRFNATETGVEYVGFYRLSRMRTKKTGLNDPEILTLRH